MRFTTLAEWLAWQQRLHPTTIELGLERVRAVLARLDPPLGDVPVITVGGTNGKGSVVAYLDAILRAAGRRPGAFTSPHLLRYNERIRIDGQPVGDRPLLDAFARIDAVRGDVSLTFFEWNTLAALEILVRGHCDVLVLEVGLGGRLDAVNAVDADVAVVVSVGLDHCDYLGPTLEHIGAEKAGIFRAGRPAILGSTDLPASVERVAGEVGADVWRPGRDFHARPRDGTWDYRGRRWSLDGLPNPALRGSVQLGNAAVAVAALEAGGARTAVAAAAVDAGLRTVVLPGRFEVIAGQPEWILDVGHNVPAAVELARNLAARPCAGRTWFVCGVLRDKDIEGIVQALASRGRWIAVGLDGERALPAQQLAQRLAAAGADVVRVADDVAEGCDSARALAAPDDRVVVFGSFHTVGPARQWLQLQ